MSETGRHIQVYKYIQIKKRGLKMGKLIEFGRMFLSYGLLMLIIAVVAGVAVFIGITMAKKKNAKNEAAASGEAQKAES